MAAMSAHGIVSQVVMVREPVTEDDSCSLSFVLRHSNDLEVLWYGINFNCCFAMSSRASVREPPTPDLAALNETCASLFAQDAVCERYMTEFLS